MSIKLSSLMTRGDWIKLGILLVVGLVSVTILYQEYTKTNQVYSETIAAALNQD